MTQIQTVRGPIAAEQLGPTLAHEHIFVTTAEAQENWPAEWGDEQARIDDAVRQLTALHEAGIASIFDPTVVGLGRNIPRIKHVADRVALNIVVATGIYTYDEVPNYFRSRGKGLHPDLPEPMVDLFVQDLTVGIADTGVRAAFLKCAVDEKGLTPGTERILRAVAQAHLQTAAPIMVHTHAESEQGRAVRRVLEEEGVSPRVVMIGHCGDSADPDYLSELAEAGYLLGMDRFGLDTIADTARRVEIVTQMCRRGFASHMVLAHDTACYIDWADPAARDWLPNWNYLHIPQNVLPALREQSVSNEQIDQMLTANPRDWISGTRAGT